MRGLCWGRLSTALIASAGLLAGPCWAADPTGPKIQRRQAIQLEQDLARQQTEADVLSPSPEITDPSQVVVSETPCFTLTAISWRSAEPFDWLVKQSESFIGQCLGATSLKRLRDHLTLSLLARGYVTSRVVFPQQNLSSGELVIELIPGRIRKIEHVGQPIGAVWFPLSTASGDLANQRDLDQTLENFRRLPSQADIRFELVPGEALGETDLKLVHGHGGRVRGSIALDNGGNRSTGKAQLSGSLVIDSPFWMYDSLAVTYNTNANARSQTQSSRGSGIQWNAPIGYAALFLGANKSSYKQTVAGFNAPIEYTGDSTAYEGGGALTLYRSGRYKGQSQLKVFRKVSRNYIDGVEISVQARDLAGAEFSHTHKHFIGDWTLSATGTLRASVPSRSKNVGIIVGEPEWDGHYRLGVLNLAAGRSFKVLSQAWRIQSQLRWQHTSTSLPQNEYVSIGGRYSIRGFDGEQTLSSESGGYWRNELSLTLPPSQTVPGFHETYLALDAGRITGAQSAGLPQKSLIGTAIGLRGSAGRVGYDLSIGWPLAKPDSLVTARPAIAAYISVDFST